MPSWNMLWVERVCVCVLSFLLSVSISPAEICVELHRRGSVLITTVAMSSTGVVSDDFAHREVYACAI